MFLNEYMAITFTGINNVRMFKKNYQKYGNYLSNDSKIKQGNKSMKEIIIKCDLSDDALGADLSDFKTTLLKCASGYQKNCIKKDAPQNIDIFQRCQYIRDDTGNVINSNFKINNCDIVLNEREVLPLFSFMARITRKLSQMSTLSENIRLYAKFVNMSIAKEAEEFIENL